VEIGEDGTVYFAVSAGLGSSGGDSVRLGDETFVTTGRNDMFITAIDTAGTVKWVKHIFRDANGFSNAMQIKDIEQIGNKLLMTGSFMDGTTIIGDTSIRTRDFDPIVMRFSTEGDLHWVARAGTSNGDEGLRLTAIDDKKVYLAGVLNDLKDTLDASFGTINFEVNRKFTPFLAQFEDIYVPPISSNAPPLEGQWSLFPNPAGEQLFFTWGKLSSPLQQVSIYDLNGRRLRHFELDQSLDGELRIDLSRLPASMYILKAKLEDQVFVREFMKH
jgi:hypothetical protein